MFICLPPRSQRVWAISYTPVWHGTVRWSSGWSSNDGKVDRELARGEGSTIPFIRGYIEAHQVDL